jgi:hypothetical protein
MTEAYSDAYWTEKLRSLMSLALTHGREVFSTSEKLLEQLGGDGYKGERDAFCKFYFGCRNPLGNLYRDALGKPAIFRRNLRKEYEIKSV